MDNEEIFKQEERLAGSVLRRNRYSTITGEWYGPDPEPEKEVVDSGSEEDGYPLGGIIHKEGRYPWGGKQ